MILEQSQSTLAAGRFVIERTLGSGGFGVVYAAFDRERKRRIAVKMLQNASPDSLIRFKQEFRGLAGIRHRNLVRLFELIFKDEQWLLTMELVEGSELLEYLATQEVRRAFRTDAAAEGAIAEDSHDASSTLSSSYLKDLRLALKQLAQGMLMLHREGKLHRDIKPSNILVTEEGRVVLLDFGLILEQSKADETRTIIGTPVYMAPEVIRGVPSSPASDWYSVGVIIHQALTGRLPFEGTLYEIIAQKQQTEPGFSEEESQALPRDLCRLASELLRRDPLARPSGEEVLQRLGGDTFTLWLPALRPGLLGKAPFIGRAREVQSLVDLFERLSTRGAQVVHLHGSSGVGKSALLNHFFDVVRELDPSAILLATRCHESEFLPFKALDGVMDALARVVRKLSPEDLGGPYGPDINLLSRIFPVFPRLSKSDVPATPVESEEFERRAFAALADFIAGLSNKRRFIIAIDDAQWGDFESARVLSLLQRTDSRVLTVFAYTSEDSQTSLLLQYLNAAGDMAQKIHLGPLTVSDARELAREHLPVNVTEQVIDRVVELSERVPIWIEEVAWVARSSPKGLESTSIHTAVQKKMTDLSRDAVQVLEVLAIAGRPVESAVLFDTFDSSEVDRPEILEVLRKKRLIRSRLTGDLEEVEVYHKHVREAVVAAVEPDRLRELHGQLAEALERARSAGSETLAGHYLHAGQTEKAFDHALAAADEALAGYRVDLAARLYQFAYDLSAANWNSRMARKLADGLALVGRGLEAGSAFLAAANHAQDQREADYLRARAAEQLLRSGHMEQAVSILRELMERRKIAWPASRHQLVAAIFRERIWGAKAARAVADEDLAAETELFWVVGFGLALVDPALAYLFQLRHLSLARCSEDQKQLARALAVDAGYHAGTKAFDSLVTKAASLAAGNREAEGMVKLVSAIDSISRGEWRAALRNSTEAEGCFEVEGNTAALDSARWFSLRSLSYLGELQPMIARGLPLVADARARGDLYADVNLRLRVVYIGDLMDDEPERARRTIDESMGRWSPPSHSVQHWLALLARIDIALYTGNPAGLIKSALNDGELRRSLLLRSPIIRAVNEEARTRAVVGHALSTSGTPHSLAVAGRQIRALRRVRTSWCDASADALEAAIDFRKGDQAAAREKLVRAALSFGALDMKIYALAAAYRLALLDGSYEGRRSAASELEQAGARDPKRFVAIYLPW